MNETPKLISEARGFLVHASLGVDKLDTIASDADRRAEALEVLRWTVLAMSQARRRLSELQERLEPQLFEPPRLPDFAGMYESMARNLGRTCTCAKCGRTVDVDPAKCLAQGWPSCCGEQMTVGSAR